MKDIIHCAEAYKVGDYEGLREKNSPNILLEFCCF